MGDNIYKTESRSTAPGVQVGFPRLPKPGSETQFELVRQWLRDCDKHDLCKPTRSNSTILPPTRLPTRLIDVGTERKSSTICLHETQIDADAKYIALSHPWGDRKEAHFCTTRKSIETHKNGIAVQALPSMFQDAVELTRALGIRYLWIDSLCIIQGKDGDFDDEAGRMETVFSTAHCVIAASNATGNSDKLFTSQRQRECVKFERENEPPFYICQVIDDFPRDVIRGPLSKRGWVLQERALARRTIYFGKNQIYWECGIGVRCETLTRMHK